MILISIFPLRYADNNVHNFLLGILFVVILSARK